MEYLNKKGLEEVWEIIDSENTSLVEAINNKVDKISGKGLSTNDFTTELKDDYDYAAEVAHTHDNKNILDELSSEADNLVYNEKALLSLEQFFALQRTGKVYGVKVYKSSANPTSVCEKTRDNAGLVHEPSTDTVEGRDDYENIPLFKWYEVNYKRYDDGFAYPTAYKGDSNFQTENVDIGAMQMTFYYNWIDSSDEYRELVISDTPNEELGLRPFELAVRADGTVMPYFIQSRFVSVLGTDGLLHSMHGKVARHQSYDNMIVNYQKKR